MNRVFINDVLKAHDPDREETELEEDTEIRFETDFVKWIVRINNDNELEIYKIATFIPATDTIKLEAPSCNKFILS